MSDDLLDLFRFAIDAVSGTGATHRALLRHLPDLSDPIVLVAVGKAAADMTMGAVETLGERITRGLVLSKYGHIAASLRTKRRFECHESAHPVPDEASLQSGQRLVEFVRQISAESTLLLLVSGGASALVERLPPGVTLQDLQRVNRYLLAEGWDIGKMNRIRRGLSAIKGGRLAAEVHAGRTLQLLISDVPGDRLSAIGSGLMVPPPDGTPPDGTPPDTASPEILPEWLQQLLTYNQAPPSASDPSWSNVFTEIIASNAIARDAVRRQAELQGWRVRLPDGELTGDVAQMAKSIAETVRADSDGDGVFIWGGETTVRLPHHPGRGGRNQQLALQLAVELSDVSGWRALCCGTDGSDGPTADAGGLVNSQTLADGARRGMNAKAFLDAADAGTYLERTGSLVTTGPTGTNVMDLVIVAVGHGAKRTSASARN